MENSNDPLLFQHKDESTSNSPRCLSAKRSQQIVQLSRAWSCYWFSVLNHISLTLCFFVIGLHADHVNEIWWGGWDFLPFACCAFFVGTFPISVIIYRFGETGALGETNAFHHSTTISSSSFDEIDYDKVFDQMYAMNHKNQHKTSFLTSCCFRSRSSKQHNKSQHDEHTLVTSQNHNSLSPDISTMSSRITIPIATPQPKKQTKKSVSEPAMIAESPSVESYFAHFKTSATPADDNYEFQTTSPPISSHQTSITVAHEQHPITSFGDHHKVHISALDGPLAPAHDTGTFLELAWRFLLFSLRPKTAFDHGHVCPPLPFIALCIWFSLFFIVAGLETSLGIFTPQLPWLILTFILLGVCQLPLFWIPQFSLWGLLSCIPATSILISAFISWGDIRSLHDIPKYLVAASPLIALLVLQIAGLVFIYLYTGSCPITLFFTFICLSFCVWICCMLICLYNVFVDPVNPIWFPISYSLAMIPGYLFILTSLTVSLLPVSPQSI